jgi:hypothetical protein
MRVSTCWRRRLARCRRARGGLLRAACVRSRASSHPLQCKALKLCFNVALNRLATVGGPGPAVFHHVENQVSPLSNALATALRRPTSAGALALHPRRSPPGRSLSNSSSPSSTTPVSAALCARSASPGSSAEKSSGRTEPATSGGRRQLASLGRSFARCG